MQQEVPVAMPPLVSFRGLNKRFPAIRFVLTLDTKVFMSWLLWEKLLHEGNKRFQRKTKVFNTKLKFREPKQSFSAKVC